jgi:hypothetical protein
MKIGRRFSAGKTVRIGGPSPGRVAVSLGMVARLPINLVGALTGKKCLLRGILPYCRSPNR